MQLLGLLKGGGLIALVMHPHGKNDPDPYIGKCTHRHRMALAFSTLALVILHGPWFTLRCLPGELMQAIAQGLDTAQSPVRVGVHPALKEHRRGPRQRLQTTGILIAASIIPDFCQQSWSQTFACTWQALKELMVLMGQKKGVNLFVVLRNLLEQRQQLTHQHPKQTRFGAGDHGIGLQVGLVQPLDNLLGDDRRIGMLCSSQDLLDLLRRSGYRFLWGGIGLQEQQGALLLQFRKQLQGHRVIGFEAGRELINQSCLHADQGILIAREQFQLGNLLAVRVETVQIGQVRPSGLGQQVGVNRVRLGSRGGSSTIDRARISQGRRASLLPGGEQSTTHGSSQ